MPRGPRLLLSHSFYHVITRANNRVTIFKSGADYQYYISLIIRFKKELPFDLYHYCLMPNHTHFLIRTKEAEKFSMFMKKLNLAYFYHFKKSNNWVGHLWQDRFRSQSVGKDEYFVQCGKYIELNPVRAGLVEYPSKYPYSSNLYYSFGAPNEVLSEDMIYHNMGKNPKERQKRYRDLLIDELVAKTYNKNIWGSGEQRYNEARKIRYHS